MQSLKFFFLLILFFLLTQPVHASGITCISNPVTIDFEPGMVHRENYTCWGSDYITFEFQGELAPYASVVQTTKDNQGRDLLTMEVRLPEEMPHPGIWEMKISATNRAPGGGGFSIQPSMRHRFQVIVPYPGKYIDMGLEVPNVPQNESGKATLHLASMGKESIQNLNLDFSFLNEVNETVFQTSKQLLPLVPQERRDETLEFDVSSIRPGKHIARAKLTYDGNKRSVETPFKIGSMDVSIFDVSERLDPGVVAGFFVKLEANWREKLPTYVEVYIGDKLVGTTPTRPLGDFRVEVFSGYVDIRSFEEGAYNLTLKVFFGDHTKEFTVPIEIAQPPTEEAPKSQFPSVLIIVGIAVVLLIGAIVVLLILIIKHR